MASVQRSTGTARIQRFDILPPQCEEQASDCQNACPSIYEVKVRGSQVQFKSLDRSFKENLCDCFTATGTIGKWGNQLVGSFPDQPGHDFSMKVRDGIIEAHYHTVCTARYKVTEGTFLSITAAQEKDL